MNIESIMELEDWDKRIAQIESSNKPDFDPAALQETYDGAHEILNRDNKIKTDNEGNAVDVIETAKMVLQFQKKIVDSAVAFLFGSPASLIKTTEQGDEAFAYLQKMLKKVKFNNQNRELARYLFTQRRAAKLYYIKNPDQPEKKLGCIILSAENGNFYPNWNDDGDMDAFMRLYTKKMLVDGKEKEIDVFELYTETQIIKAEKLEGAWVETSIANPYAKIPVVYYEQDSEEWADVQSLIDRQELSLSELVDTNQYFASPIIKIIGQVENMPNKNDQGKAINCRYTTNAQGQLEKGDAQYLTWDQRPESLKMQFDIIEKYIYAFSNTPDISFTNMLQNKPGNISGTALQLLLLDPILKSYNKQEIFDENLQRELSVVMAILGTIETGYSNDYVEMDIDIQFNSILPDNIGEVINYLSVASGGDPIISKETAVNKNPLVLDKIAEIERLNQTEATQAGSLNF
jgi:SPP1 family phage portal protein